MIIKDTYCVYMHSSNGEVFYVGKGRSYRPFEFSRRNDDWVKFAQSANGEIEVTILEWFDLEDDALLYEAMKIRDMKPACNKLMNGHVISDTHRSAISNTHKGKMVSQRARDKISKAMKGRTPANKGKPMSASQKDKIRKSSRCKKVRDSSGRIFDSVKSAAIELNIPYPTLKAHLSGKLKHARGHKLCFA